MKSADLDAEMLAATQAVRQAHIDRLIGLGVSGAALATLGSRQLAFGVAQVEPCKLGLYQPCAGAEHVVMPVMEVGETVDLIAWRTTQPNRWAWRFGIGWALGTDFLLPRWDDGPVPLFATPLEWMAAAGEGICVLDWSAPELRELASLEAIEADETTGRRLLATLSKPARMPRFIMRKAVKRAA